MGGDEREEMRERRGQRRGERAGEGRGREERVPFRGLCKSI
jgi:hypothetical protein